MKISERTAEFRAEYPNHRYFFFFFTYYVYKDAHRPTTQHTHDSHTSHLTFTPMDTVNRLGDKQDYSVRNLDSNSIMDLGTAARRSEEQYQDLRFQLKHDRGLEEAVFGADAEEEKYDDDDGDGDDEVPASVVPPSGNPPAHGDGKAEAPGSPIRIEGFHSG